MAPRFQAAGSEHRVEPGDAKALDSLDYDFSAWADDMAAIAESIREELRLLRKEMRRRY